MPMVDDVRKALEEGGKALKSDLWKAEDKAFLTARAKDLVGLAAKASAAPTAAKRAAYLAAARDTVNHVRLLAMIRMEVATKHVVEALGRFFLEKVLPVLIRLLPALAKI